MKSPVETSMLQVYHKVCSVGAGVVAKEILCKNLTRGFNYTTETKTGSTISQWLVENIVEISENDTNIHTDWQHRRGQTGRSYVNVKLIYIHSLITLLSSQPVKLLKWTAVALPWEETGGRKSSGCLGLDFHQHTVRQIFECKQFSRNPYEEKNMRLGTERLPPWATQVPGIP